MVDLLRAVAPPALAVVSALLIDQLGERRGLLPPAFRGSVESLDSGLAVMRRVAANLILVAVLWLGVFAPLGALGTSDQLDPSTIARRESGVGWNRFGNNPSACDCAVNR